VVQLSAKNLKWRNDHLSTMLLQLEELLIILGTILALFIVGVVINTFVLKIAIKAVRGEKTTFGNVLFTSLLLMVISAVISYAVNWVLPDNLYIGSAVALVIELFFIKARHRTTLLGALGALILYVIVLVIFIVVLMVAFASTFAAILTFIGL